MKPGFETIAEVIDFAVMREEEARQFYIQLSRQAPDPFMQQIFMDFAHEEQKHRDTLKNLDKDGLERIFSRIMEPINDMGIAEITPDTGADTDMDFKQALTLAMKREDKSEKLYSLLAETCDDDTISLMFVGLAREETRHRIRIERAYNALYQQ
ncbi:MAG: ferritin family protein [Desulfosalsimonas sp.]|uniref:ferritin family protein n=1 Tax=Desulfosalsimonas sp. TaxID=3073848 RepID=UPI003970F3C3